MIEYWHWHTLHFGTETYWGGVLPHSGVPGRAYREIARLGAELGAAGAAVRRACPDYDVAVLYDSDSKFALSFQAPFPAPGQYLDPDSYRRIMASFVRGAFDAGLQTRIVRPQQLFPSRATAGVDQLEGGDPAGFAAQYPVLIVPAFFTAADSELDWLEAYAAAGGHLVLGPRSAYADREGRARREVQPARLAQAAGAWYEEFANIAEPVSVSPVAGVAERMSGRSTLVLRPGAAATDWVDGLMTTEADSLVAYEHPHLGRFSAITSSAHGTGRVTLVGTIPNQALAHSLASWLVPEPIAGWADLPPSVTVSTKTAPDGSRVHIVHNWSWTPVTVTAPTDLRDLIDAGAAYATGTMIELGAWDVRVFGGGAAE